jgi:hypothetical protein
MVREDWVDKLWQISRPVLEASANGRLKSTMPVAGPFSEKRHPFSFLEACGRTLAGIAPWLECKGLTGQEAQQQQYTKKLCQAMLVSITDPSSPDFLNFNAGPQSLVDAAYLAQGLLRAPEALWRPLTEETKKQIISALIATRRIKPYFNNWLLFSAMIEAFFCKIGAPFDAMRIDYAMRQTNQWYAGDGLYSDGPEFHSDYYNSYVIHPFLLDILKATSHVRAWAGLEGLFIKRAQRYAELLERMISPEGTMPVMGRSITYRCGNLHAIAQLALMKALPESLRPSQVRSAMEAVIYKTLLPSNTFDDHGWLNIGLCGHQPSLAEEYISTGSLYLATLAFLPLGLPPEEHFWKDSRLSFSSQMLYAGKDGMPDKAWDEKNNH